nr:LOW QUALITY PROTEIN: inositol polyphosphate 5-phosphatase E-like [Dermatophagoides farinae]
MNKQQQKVLPPVTYDQIQRNRFIYHDSNIFCESFFSQNELERFFPDHKIRLSIITWNMGSKPPNDYNQSLQELLHLKPFQPLQYGQLNLPEMFVIGLQETPNSEMIVNSLKVGIQSSLGPNYCLLRWSSVGVLHCSIWIRRELLWSCTTVDMVPVHMRPMAANRIYKGAITLSFTLFGTSFLFINTHLTAHEINLRSRMNQLDKVQQILNLKYPNNNSANNNIRDHNSEFIFWFGDLNFRLELPVDIVLDAIRRITNTNNPETKDTYLRKMMRSDQLSNLMNRGIIFNGFEEARWPPPFLPTYKCKINHPITGGLATNDPIDHHINTTIIQSSSLNPSTKTTTSITSTSTSTSSSSTKTNDNINGDKIVNNYNYESGRVPSYTDRILYQTKSTNHQQIESNDNNLIKCIYYNSISNIISSDHKPVYGLFEVRLDSGCGQRKRLSQLVDEMYLKRLAEKHNNNNNAKTTDQQQQSEQSSSDLLSDQQQQSITKTNHFRRLVDRHVFKKSKSKLTNNHHMDNLDIMDSGIGGGINESSANSSSSSSSSIIMANNQRQWSDRVGQLNAGAYERKIYMEGMRLRNNLMQSTSMQEIRNNGTMMTLIVNPNNQNENTNRIRVMKNVKKSENGNGDHGGDGSGHHLYKSHSLESNLIIMNGGDVDDNNGENDSKQQRQISPLVRHESSEMNQTIDLVTNSRESISHQQNDRNSKICQIM